jgi:hypothetical protein
MRAAGTMMLALLVGGPAWVVAQAPRPASAPETFSANAQAKSPAGTVSSTLEIRITRYTPDFDRTTMETALRQRGGYPGFLTALRKAPVVGQVVMAGGQSFAIRYARETTTADKRSIVVVTDKPVFFLGGAQAEPKPRAGYEIAVAQIQVDASGKGSGTLAAAARVRPGGDGSVILDDYADAPIELTTVTRKSS